MKNIQINDKVYKVPNKIYKEVEDMDNQVREAKGQKQNDEEERLRRFLCKIIANYQPILNLDSAFFI